MRKGLLIFTLCFAFAINAIAQITVTGTVVDTDGQALPGVTVLEKGTMNGTSTSVDGNYTLTVASDAVLVFSFIGYTTTEVPVEGRTTVNVTLELTALQMDEVVVTALGVRREARALGYSVSSVDSDRIMASGTPPNLLQSLYGAAAGVSIGGTASGPSGGMRINIRNAISFDAASSTRPLIVVDGIPIFDQESNITANPRTGRDHGTGINDINPNDIESIEILKGAKASVLYGSAGANGVILITTKTGTERPGLGVSASFSSSVDRIAFMPELQREYGTGRSPSTIQTDTQGFYLDENGNRALDWTGVAFGPRFDANQQVRWWDGTTRPWVANDRTIYEQLFRTGYQNSANVELSSGFDAGSIRFSYTNMQMTPVFPNSKYDRNNFSVSANAALNDNISIRYSGNHFITNNFNSAYNQSFSGQGAQAQIGAYSADIDVDLIRDFLVTPEGYNYFANPSLQNLISTGRQTLVNSLWDWTQDESEFRRVHTIQSVTMDVKFNETFGATLLGGFDNTTERSSYKGRLRDPSLIGPNSGSVYSDATRNIRETYGQGILTFDTDINPDFNLNGFAGGVIRHSFIERKGAEKIGGFVIPNFFSFSNLPSGVDPQYQFLNGEDMLYSVLGSIQLGWRDQIYLEAQGRNDWSSILPPGNNSYFYPGVSATWIASTSLDLPDVVDFLKLRTSWADVGRPGPRYFSNVNLGISQSGGGFIVTPPGFLPPMDENFMPNLKPEKKREFEVGLESFVFNRRLGIDFSYYVSNTYNQIMAVSAPPGLGVSSIRMNAGDVANQGWELALRTVPVNTRDFRWNIDFAFSSAKTKVLELDGELTSLELWGTHGLTAVAEVGGEYGLIYQQRGNHRYINPSDDNDPNNGKLIVAPTRMNYAYSTLGNKKVGKILPDVIGGVFSSVNYRNFRLIFNIDYSFGATFLSAGESYMMAAGILKESLPYRDAESGGLAYHLGEGGEKILGSHPGGGATFHDGVLLDGVLPNGQVNDQVVSAQDYYYQTYFSNGFFPEDRLFKSDYVALRNLALDYVIPTRIANQLLMNELVLSVFVNNVGYFYKAAPNSVPEATDGTARDAAFRGNTALPMQRSIGMSINVKF